MEAARELLLELGVEPRVAAASAAVLAELAASRRALGLRSMTTQQAVGTSPSDRARALVQGAYDLHVHVAPDVPQRRIDDRALARRFAELGLAGFALKSHYTSTAERAQVVSALVPEVEVVGTLTLNWAVGGMNALAVEIAAREGARIVWMPTVDSPAETAGRTEPKDGDKVPQWARLQHELRSLGLSVDAVHVTDPDGGLLPETRDVLRAIARHDLILATGHLARDDTFAVVDGALEEGVARHRRHAPGVPVPELLARGPARARRARLPARALPDHAVEREDRRGSTSSTACARSASSARSSRATAGTRTTRPSRTGSRSGPTACSAAGSTRTRSAR